MAGLTQQATTANRTFGAEAGPNSGKSERMSRSAGASPLCPQCGSSRLFKDGNAVQRWLCRDCGYRFSQTSYSSRDSYQRLERIDRLTLNRFSAETSKRQVCDLLTEESKNLTEVTRQEQAQREGTTQTAVDAKGKILSYLIHLQNNDTEKPQPKQNMINSFA